MNKLKKFIIVLLLLAVAFWGYVEIVNRNSKQMTGRQKVLRAIYPLFTGYKRLVGKGSKVLVNNKNIQPIQSLYDLSILLNDSSTLHLAALKGKKILLVNTASDCGYTAQYNELQELHEKYPDKLVVIGFPANDFKEQEKGSDAEIAEFCKRNFGVTFPLAQKSSVIKTPSQNAVFQWLADKNKNGWNDQPPSWNFSKYLINEQGVLTHYFDPSVSPVSKEVIQAIQ